MVLPTMVFGTREIKMWILLVIPMQIGFEMLIIDDALHVIVSMSAQIW